MQIVILSGGEGSRLGELTKNSPKGLIKINKKPFMSYLIESIIKYYPSSIHFCLGKYSDKYLDYLNNIKLNFKWTYSLEDENQLLGTGGAIKNALNFLEDIFIIQYGDTLLEIDYRSLINYHINSGKKMTISMKSVANINDNPNILCKKDAEGIMTCIYDKKKYKNIGNFIDYGALVLNKEVFTNNLPEKFDLSSMQKNLSRSKDCSFYQVSSNFIEIGNKESLRKAKSIITNV